MFSLLAPFVLPIINQVKNELETGSSEIIQSSRDKQHIVFHDDYCSDPTHSMLSKDHFSNVLNEPAGKTASQILKWVVPQIMAAWDDERVDIYRTLNRIINGVFHHPAQRDYGDDGASDGRRGMFMIVEQWWNQKNEREKDYLRDQLSRDGVEQGRNHKHGVHDKGHGCGKPLGMPNMRTAASSGAVGGLPMGNIVGEISSALSGESQYDPGANRPGASGGSSDLGKIAGEAVGGGALGGIVGGLAGAIGGDILGGTFGESEKKSKKSQYQGNDGSYTQSFTQSGYNEPHGRQPHYGRAQYSETSYPGGRQRQQYDRYETSTGTYGGSATYEQRTEKRFESSGEYQSESRYERRGSGEGYGHKKKDSYKQDSDSEDERKKAKHKKKKKEKKKHHSDDDDSDEDSDEDKGSRRQSYRREEQSYGEGYGGRQETYGGGYGRQQAPYGGGYGRQQESYGRGYGRDERSDARGYGRQESSYEERGGGMPGSFGGDESYGSGRQSYGRSEEYGSGGGGYGGGFGGQEPGGYGGNQGFRGDDGDDYGRRQQYSGDDGYQERRGDYGGGGYQRRSDCGNDY